MQFIKRNMLPGASDGKFLKRERLHKLFSSMIDEPLLLVQAGSGYGKTQETALFLKTIDARIVWMPFSHLDNLPTRFWESLCYFLENEHPLIANEFLAGGFPGNTAQFEQFSRRLSKEIYSGRHFIMVFDDFHLIHDQTVRQFLESLVSLNLENFTVILISRYPVCLNLSCDYAAHKAPRITESDLRFTTAETKELFLLRRLTLSEDMLSKIMNFTEGWALAVSLMCLSMEQGSSSAQDAISDIMPFVHTLIENEIFSGYSPYIRNFLIKLSLLNEFTIPLLKELAGPSYTEEILHVLNTNMFIHYNPELGLCSFHYMFLNFLKERRLTLSRTEIEAFYMKAGNWYLKHNFRIDAIEYYRKCNAHEKILEAMSFGKPTILSRETAEYYIERIQEFPEELSRSHPIIALFQAGFLLNNSRRKEAETLLLQAISRLEKKEMNDELRRILGEYYLFLGMSRIALIDDTCRKYYRASARYIPEGSSFMDTTSALLDNQTALHLEDVTPGALDRLVQLHKDINPDIITVHNMGGAGLDLMAACERAFFQAGFAQVKKLAPLVLEKAEPHLQLDIIYNTCYMLLRTYIACGDLDNCLSILEKIRQLYTSHSDHMQRLTMYDMVNSFFYIKTGEYDKIPRYLLNDTVMQRTLTPSQMDREKLIKAYYLLAEKRYYELAGYLEQLELYYKEGRIGISLLGVYVIKSVTYYSLGEQEQCVQAFQRAYYYGYHNNLIMPFIEFGNRMRSVVDTVRKADIAGLDQEWLKKIYRKSATYAKRLSALLHKYQESAPETDMTEDHLTPRELILLRDISQGLTREEIAASLAISPNTVKSALQALYAKLDAVNLADAVRIAVSRGII